MDRKELNSELKINSKQYKRFVYDVINEYNSNGKKTLLLTCDSFFPTVDGVVNVMDSYAHELSSKMNVIMLAPDYKNKVYMKGYPVIGIESGYSKKLHNQVPLPFLDSHYKRYLKKLRIDIIHCHSPFTISRVAMNLHKRRKIPLVNTFHSQYKRDFVKQAKPLTPILMKYIMRCYNSSDEVWTMHTASKDTLISYGYRGNVILMPNGTSMLPSTDYEKERAIGREKYMQGDTTCPLFIFVGRLVTQKNILFIIDVLANLKKRGLKFKMLFAGEGPDKDLLIDKIASEQLNDEVTLLGHMSQNEISEIYAAADMLLFPSMYDVSSLVQVEAASRYTPAAFAEGSVTSCTVTNGVNGYVFPCDTDKFADGVYQAITNPSQLKQIGTKAFDDLYITWDKIIQKVYLRYNELIDNNQQNNLQLKTKTR